MERGTSMKSAVPTGGSGESGSRRSRGGGGGSGSVTAASSRREQQRRLESCEPAEIHKRNKKISHTKQLPPPKFLKGLVQAVTDRSDVINFKDGSVTVKDHAVLVSEVLPRFFKASTTLRSFLRQLNYFAFKKVGGKGAKQPGVFHNADLEGKEVEAIISLKRRTSVKPDEESTTAAKNEPPRLPRSTGFSVFAREAAVASAFAALVASGSRAHNRVPPPPTTRSSYTSSTLLPPSSMTIDTQSRVAVTPTNADIHGYARGSRALATGKNDCDVECRHGWCSFDARGTDDTNCVPSVSCTTRNSNGTVDRSGFREDNVGGSSDRPSDGASNSGASPAKRKLGEHFEDGAVANEGLETKRVCRHRGCYCLNMTDLRSNGSHRAVVSGGSDGNTRAAGEEASRQLLSLAKTKLQQHPRALLEDRAHLGVPGPSREDRSGFVFGYDHGRDGVRPGAPSSSRKSIFSAILPLSGLAWRVQPVTPCTEPNAFVEPPSTGGCSLGPEMVMAVATGRSLGTGSFLRGTCANLDFSAHPDRSFAPEKVVNTTPAVGRGTSMSSTIEGIGGNRGVFCSEVRGSAISPFGAEVTFGPFCAVEGDVSPDCLDECFLRERVSSAPNQESLTELGNGGNDFGVGLFHDYSC